MRKTEKPAPFYKRFEVFIQKKFRKSAIFMLVLRFDRQYLWVIFIIN